MSTILDRGAGTVGRVTTIHRRLETARTNAGLSQAELAKRVGVTRSAVNQWESGQTKHVRPENLFAVADATGHSARWIATGKGLARLPIRPEDGVPAEIIDLAERLQKLSRERRELLLSLLGQAAPDPPLPNPYLPIKAAR